MTNIEDKEKQNKEYLELKQKLQKLQENINKNLTNLSESANNILMDSVYYLVDYVRFISDDLKNIASSRNIYILEFLNMRIEKILLSVSNDDFVKLEILAIHNLLKEYKSISDGFSNVLNKYLDDVYSNALSKVNAFSELNDIYKNHKTYEIYKQSEDLNNEIYKKYIKRAVWFAVIGFVLSSLYSLVFTQCFFGELCILEYKVVDYWVARASILLIAITGVTFCLKQAIHHQKKKDEAERMRLELEALPTYMFNFSDEQKNRVYAELTSKYFGRDFDNTGYQDMGNVIQEQIKLNNEILKGIISEKLK